jgi:FtsZ-interacting cell division protein YlmF
MKRWIEVSPYNGLEEDAPTNNAGSGDVSMPPDAVKKKKKTLIDRSMIDARTKAYREHKTRLETRRAKREAKKSAFIEKIKETAVSELAYGSGYDMANPVADIQPVYAAKSATGYEIYHKDFSGAMQHAYKFAKTKGVIVDPSEIDNKVATGPSKPSNGKTNKYILGTNKKNTQVHIQVYNTGNKYELNMYID